MKPLFFLITSISFPLSLLNAQTLSPCNYKEQAKEFLKAANDLASHIKYVKDNATTDQVAKFEANEKSGLGLSSFSAFGTREEEFKTTYINNGNTMDEKAIALIGAIDPDKKLSDFEIRDKVKEAVKCYLTDTTQPVLMSTYEKEKSGIQLQKAGPCEREGRKCLSDAQSSYTQNLIACGFGAGGIQQWLKGWWGAASGLICYIGASTTYNDAKWTCFDNYIDCIGGN